MPNLLKKLMKPSSRASPQPNRAPMDLVSSPTPTRPLAGRYNTDDLTDLAQKVLGKIEPRESKHYTNMKEAEASRVDLLAEQVRERLHRRAAADAVGAKSLRRKEKKGKRSKVKIIEPDTGPGLAPAAATRWAGDDGQKVMDAIIESIELVDQLQADGVQGPLSDALLERCDELLSAQRDEVKDAVVHMERGRYPALRTLRQVYERVVAGLTELELFEPSEARSELETLVQLLEEGPDYLIDTFLIELIIHHSETLDSALAAEVREIYKKAVASPGDLAMFRKAAQGIVAYACAIPEEDLEDEMGREAYRTIGVLVKQLKLRVEGEQASSRETSTSSDQPRSILKKSSASSPTTSDDEAEALAADALQARFGTGPLPSRPAATTVSASAIGTPADPLPSKGKAKASPPASPASPASSNASLDSISLYDYRGQILTASALDLVMRQEALALADSTGQYTGDVSWDDIRQAWIPIWVVKLKPEDLAQGEIPSTNPADFEVKKEDEFGNKIGWTDVGEMYYEEEPSFELK